MTDFEMLLDLCIVPGKVGIWVGVGAQPAVYVKCQPSTVKQIERQLMRTYMHLAGQGAKVTPAQVRDVATRPAHALVSYADMGLLPLVLS